jgi:HAD superfamily hydrolase (TIGR01509 family)
MKRDVVFLGSLGVVADTSDMQRRAFNAAFAEAGLEWAWSTEKYKKLLRTPGGRARIEEHAAERGEVVDSTALHRRKSEIFQQMITDEGLRLRPGVESLVEMARDGKIRLAWVSSTLRESVDAYLEALGDALSVSDFALVTDGTMVRNTKPDPAIYRFALDKLSLSADSVIAVEDTPECVAAASAAGIDCIAFPNAYNEDLEFPGAVAVVDRLTPAALER